ncbi:hypothetical protein O6H91_13G090000 [Diphasiastrum complanatum]|uniref:Uncharacterized protein n=1 Tax=Diphasiastrum complanatum TaxID=34168 RepID=A0ACC2BXL3_DIPCM|nr:hypothetical protein O6H91_13G090000 [Diphasiastrum complanatum]
MPSAAPVCNVLVQSDSGRWTLVEWYGLSLIMWCTTSPFHRIASSPAQPVHQSSTLSTASSVRRTSFTPSLTKQLQLPHQPTPLDSHISRLLLTPSSTDSFLSFHSSFNRLISTPPLTESFHSSLTESFHSSYPHQPTPLDDFINRLLPLLLQPTHLHSSFNRVLPLLQPTHLHSSICRLLLTPSSDDSF